MRVLRVALAGCGVVGSSLLRLIEENEAALAAEHGLRFEVVGVLVRDLERDRPHLPRRELLTDRPEVLIETDADLVVEALGGIQPALGLARETLRRGKRFVTANKALIAAHGSELLRLAAQSGGGLDFEAAVGGGLPLIRTLRDSLPETGVVRIRGILNGTSNYILTRLSEGAAYEEALADAQAAGFAEADPSRDLDGRDIADKMAILSWLAFGISPEAVHPVRTGILPDPERLVRAAAAFGRVVRLVGDASLGDEGVSVSVEPVAVHATSELGRIRNERNWVQVETQWNGVLQVSGPGAGGLPTASAVLADMVRPARGLGAVDRQPGLATDDSEHAWLVVAGREGVATLRYGIERQGGKVAERRDSGDGDVLLRTEPMPRGVIQEILSRWPGALPPLLLRWEAGEREASRKRDGTRLRSAWL